MKTTITTLIYAVTAVLVAVSCQKSIGTAGCIDANSGTIDICVNGLLPEYSAVDAAKAELVNTVRVSWNGSEPVYVFDGTQCLGSLVTDLDGTDGRYAKLSTDGAHTVKEPVAGTKKLTLVHSELLRGAPTVNDGKISINLNDQDSPTTPFVAFATLDYSGTDIKNAIVSFQFATSVIRFNCLGLDANTAIEQADLVNVNTTCVLELKGDAAPNVKGGGMNIGGRITRTNDLYFAADKVNAEGEAVFQIAVPVLDNSTYWRSLIVRQGKNVFEDRKLSKNEISAGISVNAICQLEKQTDYPADAIPGRFSISNGFQVCFAKGNLRYYKNRPGPDDDWKDGFWNFFPNQYDCDPGVNQTYDHSGYISLFNWGYNSVNSINPESTEKFNSNLLYPGHTFEYNEDWGCTIGDGKTWRTLSSAEWVYLLSLDGHSGRPDKKRFALCKVDGYCGLLIFPDGWDSWNAEYGEEPTYNGLTLEKCGSKSYTEDQIDRMGSIEGIVFLPGAGARHGASVVDRGLGIYWTSTCGPTTDNGTVFWAELLSFREKNPDDNTKPAIVHGIGFRQDGFSVRLVADL